MQSTTGKIKSYQKTNRLSYFVYELLRPALHAEHLEAAAHPLVGAHDGLGRSPPALLQRPSACLVRLPAAQILHQANSNTFN